MNKVLILLLSSPVIILILVLMFIKPDKEVRYRIWNETGQTLVMNIDNHDITITSTNTFGWRIFNGYGLLVGEQP